MTDHKTNVLNEDTNDLSNQAKYADRVRLLLAEKQKRLGRKLSVFVQTFGCQQNEADSERLMYSAQRKLLCTDLSVNEISEAFGFCDQFYFSRYFKRRCGESPLRYRKRMQTVDFGAEPNITKVKI